MTAQSIAPGADQHVSGARDAAAGSKRHRIGVRDAVGGLRTGAAHGRALQIADRLIAALFRRRGRNRELLGIVGVFNPRACGNVNAVFDRFRIVVVGGHARGRARRAAAHPQGIVFVSVGRKRQFAARRKLRILGHIHLGSSINRTFRAPLGAGNGAVDGRVDRIAVLLDGIDVDVGARACREAAVGRNRAGKGQRARALHRVLQQDARAADCDALGVLCFKAKRMTGA